ncbi:hypothetical protein B0T17DRAFT_505870 [Bombardia bombarda]|uniref:Uncharacterized protein n=1 Tax=Bombardia bombarda TaxID=252184 RepID=A0AA39X9A6_9PEZI|nr:hypothetical protein B0T17DRAFT_505870 [Bombardia bombarda]
MSKRVPTSTQWVTFPSNPKSSAVVEWADGGRRTNIYYVAKCFWGTLPQKDYPDTPCATIGKYVSTTKALEKKQIDSLSNAERLEYELKSKGVYVDESTLKSNGQQEQPQPRVVFDHDRALNILGETKLFIAAEFVEEQYRGGPLRSYHLKDLAEGNPSVDHGEGSWLTVQLNECFQYGQSGSGGKINRWLVYHPSVAKGISSPRIFQHRFTGLPTADLAKNIAKELPEFAPDQFSAAAEAGVNLAIISTDVLKSAVGHYLHPFLDYHERGVALYLQKLIHLKHTAPLKDKKAGAGTSLAAHAVIQEPEAEAAKIMAMQVIETLVAARDNKQADAGIDVRMKTELEYIKKLNSGIKKDSWLTKAVNFFKGKGSTSAEAVLASALEDLKNGEMTTGDVDPQVVSIAIQDITAEQPQTTSDPLQKAEATTEQQVGPSFIVGNFENKQMVDAQKIAIERTDELNRTNPEAFTAKSIILGDQEPDLVGELQPQHQQSLQRSSLQHQQQQQQQIEEQPTDNTARRLTENLSLKPTSSVIQRQVDPSQTDSRIGQQFNNNNNNNNKQQPREKLVLPSINGKPQTGSSPLQKGRKVMYVVPSGRQLPWSQQQVDQGQRGGYGNYRPVFK